MPSISGHNVLVIGGSSGMGFSTAQLALEQGAIVHIASSSSTRVDDAISRLNAAVPNGDVHGHVIDLEADDLESKLDTFFQSITSTKKLDHIVYTAARAVQSPPFKELTAKDLRGGTDFLVPRVLVAKVGLRYLNPAYTSSLTYTGGHVDTKPMPNYAVSCAAAASLRGLVRALALETAPVRVNMVSTGAVITEMWGPAEVREQIRNSGQWTSSLLGKVGDPEEVAEAFVYLMRNGNSTGSVVETNGGSLLK
jgi:NAD(P)-dependent dehydrogenase (short-subunit alcohol dehydrogenase family)